MVRHGALDIDNNVAERSLRGIALGRKYWLFVGSEQRGHTAKTRFDSLRTSPSTRKVADLIGKYLQLREESWRSLVIGLRESNQAAIERYREQSAAADRLTKQIGGGGDR